MNRKLSYLQFLLNIIVLTQSIPRYNSQSSSNQQYETCRSSSYRCGDLLLGYPFWGGNDRPASCGYPGFELSCENDNTPLINISSTSYRVLTIRESAKTLTIAREDLWDTICTSDPVHTPLNFSIFRYYSASNDQNITLYYGCAQDPIFGQLVPSPNRFSCGSNNLNFYFTGDFSSLGAQNGAVSSSCSSSFSVMVNQSQFVELERNTLSGTATTQLLQDSLRGGFTIQWSADDEKCNNCMVSRGVCGSDPGSGSFACHCIDGTYDSTCGGAEPKWPKSFSCGNHGSCNFHLPLQINPIVDYSRSIAVIIVLRAKELSQVLMVIGILSYAIYHQRQSVRNEIFRNLIASESCFVFMNTSLPNSPSVSFIFSSPTLTLFVCLAISETGAPKEFKSYERYHCSEFSVFYRNQSEDDSWDGRAPSNCFLIQVQLPRNPYNRIRGDMFSMLTAEYTYFRCYKCHRRGGSCLTDVTNSFRCTNEVVSGNGRLKLEILAICVGAIILITSLLIIYYSFKAHQRRNFFKGNGGLQLRQKLASINNGGRNKSKLFSSKELAQATDHYHETRILGRGGQGTVYKGMLTDGSIVAVKKSIKLHQQDIEAFVNEVTVLSQINHRNIVKLLGCCLETKVPLLVYEFVPNGTLFQHIHGDFLILTWEMRLRIAVEIAGALSYLHSSTSAPIFHRDIKSANILLDENYRAKISDFGTSRLLANTDQTHFTTRVLGTLGYLDPEYYQSNRFTEKSDVYSFGIVMVELLTGEKAVSSLRAEADRSLATYFLRSMEEDKLFDIVDARIIPREEEEEGGKREEIVAVAQVSRRCLHLNGKLRPTMRQVANELESIRTFNNSSSALEEGGPVSDSVGPADYSSLLSLTLER